MTAKGSVDAVIHSMAIAADVELSWILLANMRYSPTVHVINSAVVIPDGGLKIYLVGDALIEIASVIAPLFEGMIENAIVD